MNLPLSHASRVFRLVLSSLLGLCVLFVAQTSSAQLIGACLNPAGQLSDVTIGGIPECPGNKAPISWAAINAPPNAVHVNCDDGESLQAAINKSFLPDALVTITVEGSCNENVRISRDKISIVGEPGAEIVAVYQSAPALFIVGADLVSISGLQTRNGQYGIYVKRGATASLSDVVARDNVLDGFRIDESSAGFVENAIAMNNGRNGFLASRNGTLTVVGDLKSQGNGNDGISVTVNSSLIVSDATFESTQNARIGLLVSGASSAGVSGSSNFIADQNGTTGDEFEDGITLVDTSSMQVSGTSILSSLNSADEGLIVARGSSLVLFDSAQVKVQGSASFGVFVEQSSSIQTFPGTLLRSELNGGAGLTVTPDSAGKFASGTTVIDPP